MDKCGVRDKKQKRKRGVPWSTLPYVLVQRFSSPPPVVVLQALVGPRPRIQHNTLGRLALPAMVSIKQCSKVLGVHCVVMAPVNMHCEAQSSASKTLRLANQLLSGKPASARMAPPPSATSHRSSSITPFIIGPTTARLAAAAQHEHTSLQRAASKNTSEAHARPTMSTSVCCLAS